VQLIHTVLYTKHGGTIVDMAFCRLQGAMRQFLAKDTRGIHCIGKYKRMTGAWCCMWSLSAKSNGRRLWCRQTDRALTHSLSRSVSLVLCGAPVRHSFLCGSLVLDMTWHETPDGSRRAANHRPLLTTAQLN